MTRAATRGELLLRRVGRVVLWFGVGLVVVRGLGSILTDSREVALKPRPAVAALGERFSTAEAQAFAVGFAQAYRTFARA